MKIDCSIHVRYNFPFLRMNNYENVDVILQSSPGAFKCWGISSF